ncbi:MAG: hypothetical protein CM1200mP13_11410 [Candidatus Pelagibacterales bacterium]|nr:MAG: hypothetical protein CM1200mP13_11410 [Pelagibacterales bacterium]
MKMILRNGKELKFLKIIDFILLANMLAMPSIATVLLFINLLYFLQKIGAIIIAQSLCLILYFRSSINSFRIFN